MALRFFSRLPTGARPHSPPNLRRIAVILPLAVFFMGIIPIALLWAGVWAGLPVYFAAALASAAMVAVGGGMMEDAIADAADGLFGGWTAPRRLEILKDSRHGTYGVSALCLFLILRITALGSLAASDALMAGGLWLAATIMGRSAGLWLVVALPAARPDGAAATIGPLPGRHFAIGALFAWLLALLLVLLIAVPSGAPVAGLAGIALAGAGVALTVLIWTALCRHLVGGQTGDLIGAAGALGEIAALTILLIFIG